MSKPQMWIVVGLLGVVIVVGGVKYFGGSSQKEEPTEAQRLARTGAANTQPTGWSVRSNSGDLPTSDDVRVQRQADVKGGLGRPPRAGQAEGTGGGSEAEPAARDHTAIRGKAPTSAGIGKGSGMLHGSAGGAKPDSIDMDGDVIHAPAGPEGTGAALPGNSQMAGAPAQEGGNTQSSGGNPTPNIGGQPAQGLEDLATDKLYDAKDEKISLDQPVEAKDAGQITGPAGSLVAEIAPGWTRENQDDADFLKLGDNIELTKNVHFLRFGFVDDTGAQHGIGTDMTSEKWDDIEPPYKVAATWDATHAWLYVNGKLVADGPLEHPIAVSDKAKLLMGSDYPEDRPIAPGELSGVKMYGQALTPAEALARTAPAKD